LNFGASEIGVAAGLTAAFLWTISSLCWSRIHMSALALNFAKNIFGAVIFFVHLVAVAIIYRQNLFAASPAAWWYLTLSGTIGIVIGDLFYFRSLQIVGPRRALLLATTAPLFAVGIKWLFLRQNSAPLVVIGILLTIAGIAIVVMDKRTTGEVKAILPGNFRMGIFFGIASALCQALGGMFSQQAMASNQCSALEGAFIRLFVAAVLTTLVVAVRREVGEMCRLSFQPLNFRAIFWGTAIGTWLGIWMSQIAFEKTDLAIASTMLTTSPLFAIPVLYFFNGQRTTTLALVGSIIAVIGVWLAITYQT
jgi:drug/metabolite transporter (DMT)-like permease